MNQASWTDTNFYLVSEKFQYTIRSEVELEEDIDGDILRSAVSTAFTRYPYFCVQVILRHGEYLVIPNLRPHVVSCTNEPPVLSSKEVNYHLIVISYYRNRIIFHVSHCLTDGAGRAPLTKTVLYYYLTRRYGKEIDTAGICLAESSLYPDEFGEPLPLRSIMNVQPKSEWTFENACKADDCCRIEKYERKEFRFSVKEDAFIRFCRSVNATPAGLISTMMAQIIWDLNPDVEKDVVVSLSLNMRSALQNEHSHLMLLGCIPVRYSPDCKDMETADLCSYTRRTVNDLKQPENILYMCRKNIENFGKLQKIKSLDIRKKTMQNILHGSEVFRAPTWTVSCMSKNTFGSLAPYVKAVYTSVDAIPDSGALIEVTAAADKLFFTWSQDFADDVFVSAFIKRLESVGIPAGDKYSGPLRTALISLPSDTQ